MTAKEALREIVEGMSEEEAWRWMHAFAPERIADGTLDRPFSLGEILRMPPAVQDAVIRAQLALVPDDDLGTMANEVEEWTVGTAGDIDLIDE